MTDTELISLAKKAAENAYAPYSDFYVGAALETADGEIYLGCNIENSAFTPTNCAERTAFFNALSSGKREFKRIAVVGGKDLDFSSYCSPCGVCRQVMSEFCDNDFIILLGKNGNEYKKATLSELLPCRFSKEDLQ